mmetsp:Transcript_25835/g.43012  ORF Transcript_25835/g.43012 Transcript_25835/m.43012 type:complete len:214 (-) Transcript_25835:67-708(-)
MTHGRHLVMKVVFTLSYNLRQKTWIVHRLASLAIVGWVVLHVKQERNETAKEHGQQEVAGNHRTVNSKLCFQDGEGNDNGEQMESIQETEFWNPKSRCDILDITLLHIGWIHGPSHKGVKESLLHDRMRILWLIAMMVVTNMLARPPERTALVGKAGSDSNNGLHEAGRRKGGMRKVAMQADAHGDANEEDNCWEKESPLKVGRPVFWLGDVM